MFFSVLRLLCLCARLFICALWSPAGKGLTSWLSFVVSYCEFVTFPLVSWVRCVTWLYRFLIFAPLLTFLWEPTTYVSDWCSSLAGPTVAQQGLFSHDWLWIESHFLCFTTVCFIWLFHCHDTLDKLEGLHVSHICVRQQHDLGRRIGQ